MFGREALGGGWYEGGDLGVLVGGRDLGGTGMEEESRGSEGAPELRQVLEQTAGWGPQVGWECTWRTPCTCPLLYPQAEARGSPPGHPWPAPHSRPPRDPGSGPGLGTL